MHTIDDNRRDEKNEEMSSEEKEKRNHIMEAMKIRFCGEYRPPVIVKQEEKTYNTRFPVKK